MRLAICGPVAANSSNSKPNFALNALSSSFLNSALGVIPTTTFPSFFAAASVFSHSLCHDVCACALVETTALSHSPNRKIAIAFSTEHALTLAKCEDRGQEEGRD